MTKFMLEAQMPKTVVQSPLFSLGLVCYRAQTGSSVYFAAVSTDPANMI
jgi:hypothetical protein